MAALFSLAAPASAQDRVPVANLSSVPFDERTEVMILATSHYAGVEGVTPSHFDTIIRRLKQFAPEIIAVERVPAHEIAMFRTTPHYARTLDTYVGSYLSLMNLGQAASGLDPIEAEVAMSEWVGSPGSLDEASQIERLMTAIAAYEVETALIYYRALGGRERDEWPDDVPKAVRSELSKLDVSTNERVAIAARLAEELGAPRIWNVDSHLEDAAFGNIVPELMSGLETAGGIEAIVGSEPFSTLAKIQDEAVQNGSLEPAYDYVNSPEYGRGDVRSQIDVFNRMPFENKSGLVRQALWDERNFRIAANLRRAMAARPGSRVLLIIGAGHKPWLDQILAATLDMRVVQWTESKSE
ncbi:DUF5694 domain-containing protein [Alteripontixanthobacter maritimus]|uniref:DUF5694 domain-containing protein n=1 Tax=Alteripontixanthobacter maritimus TaxID=2161824 RepID=UPI0011C03BA9|nr:DUF5694 domain-containing protein [Alteripontixanthobacter maritimus]